MRVLRVWRERETAARALQPPPHNDWGANHPDEGHQSAPCLVHDAISLALGEAGKAEAKHSPWRADADLFDPAELQGRFATACIFDLLEGLVGLLDRVHPFHQGKPDPRGAARDSP